MAVSIQNICGSEPDLDACATEFLVGDFSRCLTNNRTCRYAIPAGSSCYCIHPDHARLRRKTAFGPRGDQEAGRTPEKWQKSRLHAIIADAIPSLFRYVFRRISHHS